MKSEARKLIAEWYPQIKPFLDDGTVSFQRAAEIFLEKNPVDFSDKTIKKYLIEHHHGGKKFQDIDTSQFKSVLDKTEPFKGADFDKNIFDLSTTDFPNTWAEDFVNYKIPPGIRNLGVCNDLHLPFHDKYAIQACFSEFKRREVDGIYLNGDIMDYERVSSHMKKPTKAFLKDEIEVGLAFLQSLRKMFPTTPIFWKDGNHEDRLERFICSKAPELAKLVGLDTPSIFKFDDLGVTHIPENIVSKFGKLYIAHGHELGLKSGGVNVARAVRMRTGVSIMFGHFHKNQTDEAKNLSGEVHCAWAVGCLCYLYPRYTGAINQWTQGGATVELLDDKGGFRVDTFKIMEGRVI